MCIIAVYKKGVKLDKNELKTCFTNNHDGAGMMWQEMGKVNILKGYMDFDSFWEVAKTLPTNVDRAFHFRIATSGKVSAACCHPFEVCDDYKRMALSDNVCDVAFMHNGILSEFTPKGGMKASHSDSMEFGKVILNGVKDVIDNQTVRDLIELYTTSRFAIMTPSKVYLLGSFEQSVNSKAFYSNSTYKESRYTSWFKDYRGYDDYGYYGYGSSKYYPVGKLSTADANTKKLSSGSDYEYDSYDYDQCLRVRNNKYTDKGVDEIIRCAEKQLHIEIYDYQTDEDEILFFFNGTCPDYGCLKLDKKYKMNPIEFSVIYVDDTF